VTVKSTIEYTEAEFIALTALAEKITDRFFRLIEAEQAREHTRASVDDTVVTAPATRVVVSEPTPDNDDKHEFDFKPNTGTKPTDLPVPTDTPIKPSASKVDLDAVAARGHQELAAFVEAWAKNLGVEGTEQPDRVEMMRGLSNGPSAGAVLMYLSNKGGLLHGIDAIINLEGGETEAQRRTRVNLIGSTMCQIGSIFFPDIAQMYEHVDIYRKRSKA
jgi:hypothetical protein